MRVNLVFLISMSNCECKVIFIYFSWEVEWLAGFLQVKEEWRIYCFKKIIAFVLIAMLQILNGHKCIHHCTFFCPTCVVTKWIYSSTGYCRSKLHDVESRLIQGVLMITKMMTKNLREWVQDWIKNTSRIKRKFDFKIQESSFET